MTTVDRRSRGIVLILVSGLLTVLSFLGVLMLQAANLSGPTAEARGEKCRAGLAAESALAYAAGRLSQEVGYPPQGTTSSNRCDDWTFREGTAAPLDGTRNPSFGRGEAWTDLGTPDGVYQPNNDNLAPGVWTDLDGDGKFSAWSGRLRASEGPFGETFALKVVSTGGLFPVNFQPDPTWWTAPDPALARLGDNLGAVLFADGEVPERVDRSYTVGGRTGEPIRISALGRHLLFGEDLNANGLLNAGEDANGNGLLDPGRPRYGYRDLKQVEAALTARGYAASQVQAVLPYMDLGPYESRSGAAAASAQIELATAPPAMLQALWNYACFTPSNDTFALRKSATEWLGLPYPRSGDALDYTQGTAGASVMIYPDEAEALVEWALEFRRTPQRGSWLAFRRELCGQAAPAPASRFFQADVAPLLAAGWPEAAWGWARAKADAAFYAVCREGNLTSDITNWKTWGIDPGPGLPPGGICRPFVGIETWMPMRFPVPADTGPWPSSPYRNTLHTDGPPLLHALTLAPPTHYRVWASARAGGAQAVAGGKLKAAERLELTDQVDFENLSVWSPYPGLAARGIAIIDLSNKNARRRTVSDSVPNLAEAAPPFAPPAPFRGAVSGPAFNPNGTSDYSGLQEGGFVALAGKYTAHQWASLYWPFQPDDQPRLWPYQEAEWRTQTRGGGAAVPPTLYKNVPSSSAGGASPWSFGVADTNGDACTPFDFPSWTNGATMRDFSVELWMKGNGVAFELEADAVLPSDDEQNDIVLQIERQTDLGGADEKGKLYTVTFKAPSTSDITVADDDPRDMLMPPPAAAYHYGGYMIEFTAFVPDVDIGDPALPDDDRVGLGMDHVVVTVENVEESEDANGNGVLDPREDTNGDGVIGPKKNLAVTLHVNGVLAGSKKDSESISENVRSRFLRAGRAYPSHPRATREDLSLQEVRLIRFTGDEVKLYDDEIRRADGTTDVVLRETDARERFRLGRFFLPPDPFPSPRNPEFVSPAFDLGVPARVRCVGWTGLPSADPSGTERVGMTVKAGVPALTAGVPSVNGPELKGTLELSDASHLAAGGLGGPVQMLGFSVELYNLDPSDNSPLYATPLFEGIWFHIQGRGRTPAWVERD